MVENIIFDFNVSRIKNQEDIFDYIKLCKFGESLLEVDGLVPQHVLNSYEINYIVSGMGSITSGKNKMSVAPGDMYIASKGVSHNIKSNSNSRLRFIYFSFDFLDIAPCELKTFYDNVGSLVVKDKMRSGNLFNTLIDEFYSEQSMNREMCEYIMKVIILSGYRNCSQEHSVKYSPDISTEKKKTIIYSVIKYMEQNYTEINSVKEVAEKFSYTSNYLSHLFKKYTGLSLKEYMITVKMQKARDLIREGKLSLNETARLCGYDSVPSFCRMFKKYIDTTVNEIKNQQKEEQ